MADSFWQSPEDEQRSAVAYRRSVAKRESARLMVNERIATNAADLTARFPTASPGVVEGGAVMELPPEQVEQMAVNDDGGWSPFSLVDSVVGGVADALSKSYEYAIKPVIRGAFTLSEGLAQEIVQRPLTAAFAGGDFRQNYNDYGDSALLNLAQGDLDTSAEGGALGTGFFSGGQAQAESDNERTLTIDGHRATLGRALPTSRIAGEVFGNGSFAHNTIAGVSQFAADVLLDPLALVTGGSSAAANAATRVAGKSVKLADAANNLENVSEGTMRLIRVLDDGAVGTAHRNLRTFEGKRDTAGELAAAFGNVESATQRTVLIEKASDLIGNRDVLKGLAEADTASIFRSWNRSSSNMMDADLIRQLGEASDEAAVAEILTGAISRGDVNAKGFYSKPGGWKSKRRDWSVSGVAARGSVRFDDVPDAADKLDSFMRQANVDKAVRDEIVRDLFTMTGKPRFQQPGEFDALVRRTMSETAAKITNPELAEKLTKIHQRFEGEIKELRMFGVADGEVILHPLVKSTKDGTIIPTPQLTTEIADMAYQLPDITAIRRAADRVAKAEKVWGTKGWEVTADTMNAVTRDLFKPAALLRPAYVVRIGLEEQLRLAAAGYDSLFNHPLRFIQSHVLGNKFADDAKGFDAPFKWMQSKQDMTRENVRQFLRPRVFGQGDIADDVADGIIDDFLGSRDVVTQDDLHKFLADDLGYADDDIAEALDGADLFSDNPDFIKQQTDLNVVNRMAHNQRQSKGARHKAPGTWHPHEMPVEIDKVSVNLWQRELNQLLGDAGVRQIAANGYDIDAFVDWARNTKQGKEWTDWLSVINDEIGPRLLTDDAVLREHAHTIAVRIADKTGGQLRKIGDDAYEVMALGNDELLNYLATGHRNNGLLARNWDSRPKVVKREVERVVDGGKSDGRLDRVIGMLFEEITGKPTTILARYPTTRQAFVKRSSESLDLLSSNEQRQEVLEYLRDNFKLTKQEVADLKLGFKRHSGAKGVVDDVEEFKEMIGIRAAQEAKDLLFDATRRSNFQDTYNAALPFFDAWAEVTQTWAGLAKSNPAFFIKASQGLDSARESGVIYANDFGEEVFAYPGTGALSEMFTGDAASLRLEGRLQGANLVAQGVGPGFGPVVQWAVGAFMPKSRDTQGIRDWISPFGTGSFDSAGDLANPGSYVESLTPAWARKFSNAITGGDIDPVQWNSTMGDVMKVLAESGRYTPGDLDSQEALLRDAEKGARTVLLLRSLTQGVGITGGSATWRVNTEEGNPEAIPTDWNPEIDPTGEWHSVAVLANEYRRLLEHYNYDTDIAASTFIDLFGVEPFYIGQAKTRSLAELPVTEEGNYWLNEHESAARKYDSVIGFFVPPDDGGLDYGIYRSQIDRGDRQSLTADQQLQLANQSIARAILDNIRGKTSSLPKKAQNEALSQARAWLDEEYDGWQNPVLGLGEKLNSKQKIAQLQSAVDDPELADSDLTDPLRAYFQVRDAALQAAASRGLKTLSSAKVADLRESLFDFGLQLRQQSPEFAGVWSRLLSQEVQP